MSAWNKAFGGAPASERDDGGPAFPVAEFDHQTFSPKDVAELRRLLSGMTLRDYFAAHAPAQPQPWFEPAMPPEPAVPGPYNLPADSPIREELVSWVHRGNLDYEDLSSEARVWADMRLKALDVHTAWKRECTTLRFLQWPFAWADAMLKARQA